MIDEMEVTTTLTVEELAENLAKELTGYDKIPLTDHQTLALREEGKDWPADALSMIGLKRMRNIHDLTKRIVVEKVPGDFMECGVGRGLDFHVEASGDVWGDGSEGDSGRFVRGVPERSGMRSGPVGVRTRGVYRGE